MSYAQFLTDLNAALATAGLTAAAEPRDSSLARAGRGNFDGSYLIRNVSGTQPWPELSLNPSHWRADFELEVATEVSADAETQGQSVESRARAVFENTVYSTGNISRQIYQWQAPQVQRAPQDKRMIWTLRFSARWTE